jgi:hypothetical protein
MDIVDARVRLPQDRRPDASYQAPPRQREEYDTVLDLTAKMNAGTMDALLADLDQAGIGQAVMHAESEGGEDADALNAALCEVLDRHGDRVAGIGCVDIAVPFPTALSRQVQRIAEAGLLGICLEPAFFGRDIDEPTSTRCTRAPRSSA